MMKQYGMMRILSDASTEPAGGGGTPSLINTGGSNSGTPASGANGKTDLAPAATGDKPAAGSNAANTGGTASWLSALPKELQEDATIKKFADVQGLAQSYINAQRLIGADKIAIPSKHATEEDWKQVYSKLGLPESVDKYDVKFAEQATLDKKFVEDYKAQALAAGILPKQAQKLADWFGQVNAKAETEILTQRKAQVDKEIAGLKSEWGTAFPDKVQHANNALQKFADAETMAYINKIGLDNDVRFVKLMSAMGEAMFKEGTIPAGGKTSTGMTPADARKAAQAIVMNQEHPYNIKTHPGHKAAVEEVSALFNSATQKSS